MSNQPFDFAGRISEHDKEIASRFIGSLYRPPDLVIAPAGHGEYLFRWHVIPHNHDANVYFHIQTQSDPERPLHDHPWDSTSVILAGGYSEIWDTQPHLAAMGAAGTQQKAFRAPGEVIFRKATWAHRLIKPATIGYSMSLFSTGPKIRDWGFWTENGWVDYDNITHTENGVSSWKTEDMK